jgi:hypothetical protein
MFVEVGEPKIDLADRSFSRLDVDGVARNIASREVASAAA